MLQADQTNGAETHPKGIVPPGQAVFAVTMIGLGLLGLIKGDFTPTWTGVAKTFPAREALAYLSATVSLVSGIGLLSRRTAPYAARLLLAAFAIWLVVFRVPLVVRAPTSTDPWWALGDGAVMVAAAWVAAGGNGARFARPLFGLGLIPFGIAHFTYFKHTVDMVPAWLPWHTAFACFTGAAFIAAGVATITGVYARLAAALTAVQLGLFTVAVWIPVIVGTPKPSDWNEFISSVALTAAAWIVAESAPARAAASVRPHFS
jgi:uncharacterized membrane protein